MKSIKFQIAIFIASFLVGCISHDSYTYNGIVFYNYDQYVEYSINELKSPVIVKNVLFTSTINNMTNIVDTNYSIIVKDAENKIRYYENSKFVEAICVTKNKGDTIR